MVGFPTGCPALPWEDYRDCCCLDMLNIEVNSLPNWRTRDPDLFVTLLELGTRSFTA